MRLLSLGTFVSRERWREQRIRQRRAEAAVWWTVKLGGGVRRGSKALRRSSDSCGVTEWPLIARWLRQDGTFLEALLASPEGVAWQKSGRNVVCELVDDADNTSDLAAEWPMGSSH